MGAKILSFLAEISERYKMAENWAENSIFNIVKLNKSIRDHGDFYFSAVFKLIVFVITDVIVIFSIDTVHV